MKTDESADICIYRIPECFPTTMEKEVFFAGAKPDLLATYREQEGLRHPVFDQVIVRGTEAVAGALRYGRETVDAVFIDPGAGAGVLHPGIAGRAALNQGHLPAAALLFTQLGVHAGGKEGFLWKPCNILMITGIPWRTLQSWFHYNRYFQFVHLNYICICRIQAEVSRLQLYAGKRM